MTRDDLDGISHSSQVIQQSHSRRYNQLFLWGWSMKHFHPVQEALTTPGLSLWKFPDTLYCIKVFLITNYFGINSRSQRGLKGDNEILFLLIVTQGFLFAVLRIEHGASSIKVSVYHWATPPPPPLPPPCPSYSWFW